MTLTKDQIRKVAELTHAMQEFAEERAVVKGRGWTSRNPAVARLHGLDSKGNKKKPITFKKPTTTRRTKKEEVEYLEALAKFAEEHGLTKGAKITFVTAAQIKALQAGGYLPRTKKKKPAVSPKKKKRKKPFSGYTNRQLARANRELANHMDAKYGKRRGNIGSAKTRGKKRKVSRR